MTVYADVLILVNTFVNFFLLCCVDLFGRLRPKAYRTVLSALFGGLCSLYIFLPDGGFISELLIRLFCSAGMVLIAYGFLRLRRFIRLLAVLYGVSFLFCGAMIGVWFLFRPQNMLISNGIVYFHISPLVLVAATLGCYVVVRLLRRLSHRQADTAARWKLQVFLEERSVTLWAMADTGHSLNDLFSRAPVIIAEKKAAEPLLGEVLCRQVVAFAGGGGADCRLRAIPYRAVGGQGLLPAVRCDRAVLSGGGRQVPLEGPILAITEQPLGEDYNAIFNPEIL